MEAWQAFIGEGSTKGPKRARNEAVPDEAAKLKELMAVLAKLSLETAQDVRMIIAVSFLCFKVSDEDDLCKAVKIECKNHAERTRGKTGHHEGCPGGLALVAFLFVIMQKLKINGAGAEKKSSPECYSGTASVAKGSSLLQATGMHSGGSFKVCFRLPYNANIESVIEGAFQKAGVHQFFGQAPGGALERRAQDLLKELSLDESAGSSKYVRSSYMARPSTGVGARLRPAFAGCGLFRRAFPLSSLSSFSVWVCLLCRLSSLPPPLSSSSVLPSWLLGVAGSWG